MDFIINPRLSIIIFSIQLILFVFITQLNLTINHNWSDDFAAYIAQSEVLLNDETEQYGVDNAYNEIGKFRLVDEIYQWMYDQFSLTHLLQDVRFSDIVIVNAFQSEIPNWKKYNFDVKDSEIRKPDSIFIKAKKV